MKMTRKLIPAIAMLLVSAVMMSTASFAWFTMNSTVDATGMQVTAVAPASLWISQNTDTPEWKTEITLTNENTPDGQFKPATPNAQDTANAWTFNQLTDEASAKVNHDGSIAVGDAAYETSTSFYKDEFLVQLQSTEDDEAELKVQVKVTDTSTGSTDAIWKALRVAVVSGTEALTFTFDDDDSDGDASANALDTLSGEQKFTSKLVAGDANTSIVVYAWFEGADKDCFNDNALNTDTFKIDLVFSIGDVEKAGI